MNQKQDASNLMQQSQALFQRDGFLIVRGLIATSQCEAIRQQILQELDPLRGPAEFEADVRYPGAPEHRSSEGGNTPRRLLHAYTRSPLLREYATSETIREYLELLMGSDQVMLSQCHHNCIMSKHPGYSSVTSWHQDNRYWRFDRPELVSVWLALGKEYPGNGSLMFIPGSHQQEYEPGRLDRDLFLRTDLEENRALIDSALSPELDVGDVVFFHSRTFHAAGMNRSDQVKLSPVFTYHSIDNHPIPGTRSANYPSIPLKAG
jgi:phytanoyl-CoA hydroxylase